MVPFNPRMTNTPLAGVLMVLTLATGVAQTQAQGSPIQRPDKYAWLEDVHGERQMAWVKAENDRTTAIASTKTPTSPRFRPNALKVLDSPDRIADPEFRVGYVYNKWEDAQHPRGIYRRTSLEGYLTERPDWDTVIDYDALAKSDNEKWVGDGSRASGRATNFVWPSFPRAAKTP